MFSRLIRGSVLVITALTALPASAETTNVVYHVNEGVQQASRAIGNIRNHLNADPDTRIVVVTHGPGIDFLLDGAEDAQGRPFSGSIGELAARGVEFRVCNNTLNARKLTPASVVLEAKVVPSGVVEVARLQAKEHFVYLRP
ncbi:MAG: DsrE family protein [Azoarcus sp.]|jgi:intracellular sulfur oxidation DsrE/DsrF family protein|nr:DsrE family protein [Azoarcus sp.]